MNNGLVVRDHEEYVHTVRSMTRMSYLEPAVIEALATFHATFFFFCTELGLRVILLKSDAF
jgi:hypothetical protein